MSEGSAGAFFLESKNNITIVSAKVFLNLYNVPENRN